MLYLSSLDYYYFGLASYCEGKRRPGSYFKKMKKWSSSDRYKEERGHWKAEKGGTEKERDTCASPALTFRRGQCANSRMVIDLVHYSNSYIEVSFKRLKGIRLWYLLPKLDRGWDGVNRTLLQGTMMEDHLRATEEKWRADKTKTWSRPGGLLSPWLISATP